MNIRMLGHATVHRVGQITTTPQRHNFTVPKPPKTSELFTKTNTYNRKRLVWSYFLFFFCAQTLGLPSQKKRLAKNFEKKYLMEAPSFQMPGLVELSLVDMPLVDAEDADTSSAPGEHPTPDPSPYSGEVQLFI